MKFPAPISAETLKKKPVTLGLVVGALFITWQLASASYRWHMDMFLTKVEAAENAETLSEQLSEQSTLLEEHIHEYRVGKATDNVDRLEEKLYHLARDEEIRGSSEDLLIRKRNLERGLRAWKEYRDCLISDRPKCEHLKPAVN